MEFPFEPMRFSRYARNTRREWTKNRLRAAARAVKRDRDDVPLFPELARYSADDTDALAQRQHEMDTYSHDLCQSLRDHLARNWREARRDLRALPAITRAGLVRYWNVFRGPSAPVYLLGHLHEERIRFRGGWEKLRQQRQFVLAGQGRLPRRHFSVEDPLLVRIGRPAMIRVHTWGRTQWLQRHTRRLARKTRSKKQSETP